MSRTKRNKYKKTVILPVVLLIFFIILNIFVKFPDDYHHSHYALGWTDFEIYGEVKNKYIDSNNHNNPTITIKDKSGNIYQCYFQTNDLVFFDLVSVGNSIKSKPQSREASIIDSSTIKIFNFLDNTIKHPNSP